MKISAFCVGIRTYEITWALQVASWGRLRASRLCLQTQLIRNKTVLLRLLPEYWRWQKCFLTTRSCLFPPSSRHFLFPLFFSLLSSFSFFYSPFLFLYLLISSFPYSPSFHYSSSSFASPFSFNIFSLVSFCYSSLFLHPPFVLISFFLLFSIPFSYSFISYSPCSPSLITPLSSPSSLLLSSSCIVPPLLLPLTLYLLFLVRTLPSLLPLVLSLLIPLLH